MANKNENYIKLGAIMKSRDGGLYIKLDSEADLEINGRKFPRTSLSLEKPSLKFDRMLAKGVIDEAEYEEKVDKIPDFVKYEVTACMLPPKAK